mmetsp:Transcript_101221/g.241371  ORF Transcript_101221/g.241371 Transcript_101221/m.241371 type:complete len:217 (-) Transcript_101221:478-1128(-)
MCQTPWLAHVGDHRHPWVHHPFKELQLHAFILQHLLPIEAGHVQAGVPWLSVAVQVLEQRSRTRQSGAIQLGLGFLIQRASDKRCEGMKPCRDILFRHHVRSVAVLEVNLNLGAIRRRLHCVHAVLVTFKQRLGRLSIVVVASEIRMRVLDPLSVEAEIGSICKLDINLLPIIDRTRCDDLHAAGLSQDAPGGGHAPRQRYACHVQARPIEGRPAG